jgi:hypothetical protein
MRDKSIYREPRVGDLANVRVGGAGTMTVRHGVLILSYASSNVYESASCEVFDGGDIFWIETKYITLLPRDQVD